MKRKNPKTNKPFKYGDIKNHAGKKYIFRGYGDWVKKDGYFNEIWIDPSRHLNGKIRKNPDTNDLFKKGDTELRNGKLMYFKGYQKNYVKKDGFHAETWVSKDQFEARIGGKKRINPETKKPFVRGDISLINGVKKIFYSYGTTGRIDGTRVESWCTPEEYHDKSLRKLFAVTKLRAKENGIKFTITIDYLRKVFPEDYKCPILGFDLVWGSKDKSLHQYNSPSIDKLEPEKGYVPGNVVIISHKANTIKSNATYHELIAIGNWLKSKIDGE